MGWYTLPPHSSLQTIFELIISSLALEVDIFICSRGSVIKKSLSAFTLISVGTCLDHKMLGVTEMLKNISQSHRVKKILPCLDPREGCLLFFLFSLFFYFFF